MNEVANVEKETITQSTSLAVDLQKAEIDQLVTTAKAYPRSFKGVQTAILNMATLDEESAEECIYALPRGGKPIKGPSVRFAEILQQSFGNCHAAARVVHVDRIEMFVEAEGVFIDHETNSKSTARVRRRISNKQGKLFADDMIIMTGNAACAIAKRNAVLAGVPKPLWRNAFKKVERTIAGDVKTLSVNRTEAMKALALYGVGPEQVFTALGVPALEDITVDHLVVLRGCYSAIKNGEATVEEIFNPQSQLPTTSEMADRYSKKPAKQKETSEESEIPPEATTEASEQAKKADKSNDTKTEPEAPAPLAVNELSDDAKAKLLEFAYKLFGTLHGLEHGQEIDEIRENGKTIKAEVSDHIEAGQMATVATEIWDAFSLVCKGNADREAQIARFDEALGDSQ